jgi:hypothetical protein
LYSNSRKNAENQQLSLQLCILEFSHNGIGTYNIPPGLDMLKDLPAASHQELLEIATHFATKLSLLGRIGDIIVVSYPRTVSTKTGK